MNQKKLRKQVCLGFTALALASTSIMLMGTENVYAASAERQQDQTIERVEQSLGQQENPLSFTERIQRILDEYDAEVSSQRHGSFSNYGSTYSSSKTDGANESDENIKPVPAKVEVKDVPKADEQKSPTEEAKPAAPAKPAVPVLKEGRYNFDWQGTPIAQSLYAVAKIAKKDVVVNGDINGKVYISLHNVTCNQAMDYLSSSFNFNWMVDGNAIVISTKDQMLQSQVFKVHHSVDMDKLKEELKTLGIDESHIYANTESRSISVSGTPYELRQAKLRLAAIDKPVSQCLVVAQLIEVSHGKSLNLGLSYSLPTYSHSGDTSSTSSSSSSSSDDSSGSSSSSSSSLKGPWLDKLTFSASSEAHRELSKGKVISRPMVMMMNGQEGMVNFGEKVPVLSATTTSSSTDVTVTYNDIGTKLTITPSIDEEEGEIAMKISAEVSNISQWRTSGSTTAPQISTRQATTSAHLHSGQSFVIGGLMSESELDNLSGIPGLMNLPILGSLFRLHTKSKSYAEVYIMITPYIVSDEISPEELLRKVGD